MKLPVSDRTFGASLLAGKGKLEISTPEDAWGALFEKKAPFGSSTSNVAHLSLDAGEKSRLELGRAGGVKVALAADGSVVGRIRLIRTPDEALAAWPEVVPLLEDGQLFAALELSGRADGSAKASYVTGPLTPTFGLAAGGRVDYSRLKPFPSNTPARTVLLDLLGGARLPQAVDAPSEVPEPGEVLALEYGGYLDLSAGVRWGYQLSGLRGFALGKLDLAVAYEAELGAHVGLHYRLAGDFRIEALAGQAPGWVRLVVRKRRQSESSAAADVGLDADLELKGLPADPDQFLRALLGTDVESWMRVLSEASRLTDVDELKRRVDTLGWSFLQARSQAWIGKALDGETATAFLAVVQQVVGAYRTTDPRVLLLAEQFFGRVGALRKGLEALEALTGREGLGGLSHSTAWEIVNALAGDRLYEVLLEDEAFQLLRQRLQQLRGLVDGAGQRLLGLIHTARADYDLQPILESLARCPDAKALRSLADEKLKGILERLTGKAFDALTTKGAREALEDIHDTLAKLEGFKKVWYERLTTTVRQSFSANLAYAFSRVGRDECLLDVEINLEREQGSALVREATRGRLGSVIDVHDPGLVLVRRGVLTHGLEKTAHLKVNVYGWESSSMTRLVRECEHSIEADPSGLVHVYAIKALADQKREHGRRFKESVSSTFLFAAVARALQRPGTAAPVDPSSGAFLAETLDRLSVRYDLALNDPRTTLDELAEYLALAERLGLVADAAATARQLWQQFPKGFGEVSARYVVRYDDKALLAAFTLSGEELKEVAEKAVRQIVAGQYISPAHREVLSRVGFAYLSPELARMYFAEGYTAVMNRALTVTVPAWFADKLAGERALTDGDRRILVALYGVEEKLVGRLLELDALVDRCLAGAAGVPVVELEKASQDFVAMADDVDKFGGQNAFFGVFDAVVRAGSGGKGRCQSALVLEMKAPGAAEKVTRYLTA